MRRLTTFWLAMDRDYINIYLKEPRSKDYDPKEGWLSPHGSTLYGCTWALPGMRARLVKAGLPPAGTFAKFKLVYGKGPFRIDADTGDVFYKEVKARRGGDRTVCFLCNWWGERLFGKRYHSQDFDLVPLTDYYTFV